jgi:hypothetical protein
MGHEHTSSTENLAAREGTSKSSAFGSSPYKRNHFEADTANALIRSGTFPSIQCPIEAAGEVIIGQRPDQEANQTARTQAAPGLGEQTPTEAGPVEFRSQVELVDFAQRRGASHPAGSEGGIPRDSLVEFEHKRPEA